MAATRAAGGQQVPQYGCGSLSHLGNTAFKGPGLERDMGRGCSRCARGWSSPHLPPSAGRIMLVHRRGRRQVNSSRRLRAEKSSMYIQLLQRMHSYRLGTGWFGLNENIRAIPEWGSINFFHEGPDSKILDFEDHIGALSRILLLFYFFLQSFKNVKSILSSHHVQTQAMHRI